MTSYAGLDVAKQATHVCIVDEGGKVVFRGVWEFRTPYETRE
jgi:hypothetical protein